MILWLPADTAARQHFEPAVVDRFVDGLPAARVDLPEPTASTDELG
jgi:hypothetical protein